MSAVASTMTPGRADSSRRTAASSKRTAPQTRVAASPPPPYSSSSNQSLTVVRGSSNSDGVGWPGWLTTPWPAPRATKAKSPACRGCVLPSGSTKWQLPLVTTWNIRQSSMAGMWKPQGAVSSEQQ